MTADMGCAWKQFKRLYISLGENGLFLGNCIRGLLGPIHMTHGRCFHGLIRSFNPRNVYLFSQTLYPFSTSKVFKLACKVNSASETHSPVWHILDLSDIGYRLKSYLSYTSFIGPSPCMITWLYSAWPCANLPKSNSR